MKIMDMEVFDYETSKVKAMEPGPDTIVEEETRDGRHVIRVEKDEKKRYLGSRFNAGGDIDKLVAEVKGTPPGGMMLVYGLGTGEYLQPVMDAVVSQRALLVVEPNVNVIKRFFDDGHHRKIKSPVRLMLIHYEPGDINLLSRLIRSIDIRTVKLVEHPGYNQVYIQELKEVAKAAKDAQHQIRLNDNTWELFTYQWVDNPIKNLKYIPGSYLLPDFKDIYKGRPGVVVSAGPSLAKNIDLLREVQDKFVIISGGHTLRMLLSHGIHPDFIVVIDAGKVAYEEIEGLMDKTDAGYVYFERSPYKVFEEYGGKRIFFTTNTLLEKTIDRKLSVIDSGSSVAHASTNLAAYLGCDPVVFIGQDLAYTDNRTHAEETVPEKHIIMEAMEDLSIKESEITCEDIYGNVVKTSNVYLGFRDLLEMIIDANKGRKFIDATEGGAKIKGTDIRTLRSTIDSYSEIAPKSELEYDKMTLYDGEQIMKDFVKARGELYRELSGEYIKTMQSYSKRLLQYERRKDKDNIVKYALRLNKMETRLDSIYNEDRFFQSLIFSTYKRIHHDSELLPTGEEERWDKLDKEFQRRMQLYGSYELATKYLAKSYDEELESFEKENRKTEEDDERVG